MKNAEARAPQADAPLGAVIPPSAKFRATYRLSPPSNLEQYEAFIDSLAAWQADDHSGRIVIADPEVTAKTATEGTDAYFIQPQAENCLILPTSGSTGSEPSMVILSKSALTASSAATERALNGPGKWVLALPLQHIAGIQVALRALATGFRPLTIGTWPKFSASALAQVARRSDPNTPLYTSLVSPQLSLLLENQSATKDCRAFDAILVGGGRIDPALLDRARSAGLRVVTTYGMTETCGGCVYDGFSLTGTNIATDENGRVLIASSALMEGYLNRDAEWVDVEGVKYFRTSDVGTLHPDGRLEIIGRVDDIVNSGGVKIALEDVQNAIGALSEVRDCAVRSLDDPVWGQTVAALVVPETLDLKPRSIREAVAQTLSAAHAPRIIVFADVIPRTEIGKVKTAAVQDLIRDAIRSGSAWKR